MKCEGKELPRNTDLTLLYRYVFSYSIRCADKEFKSYVLNEKGYIDKGDGFKIKSRLYPREIHVTTTSVKKIKKFVDEKQVILYSEKYALKAKYERAAAVEKARDLIKNSGKCPSTFII